MAHSFESPNLAFESSFLSDQFLSPLHWLVLTIESDYPANGKMCCRPLPPIPSKARTSSGWHEGWVSLLQIAVFLIETLRSGVERRVEGSLGVVGAELGDV